MRHVFEILTFLGGLFGAFLLFMAFTSASGAPQQAAGAAMALACVVIPYCIAAMLQRSELLEQSKVEDARTE